MSAEAAKKYLNAIMEFSGSDMRMFGWHFYCMRLY